MIQIVHPIITSRVGIAMELNAERLFGAIPIPTALLKRSNIVTVEKLVGPGKANQRTDVLLVRFMLNLLAAHDKVWRDRFGGKPVEHVPAFDAELGRRIRMYQQEGGFQFPLLTPRQRPDVVILGVGDLPPLPPPVPPVPPNPVPPNPLPAPVPIKVQEPLHVDGIIDPCGKDNDRGSISKLVYTIVHLNYQLILHTKQISEMRLSPGLLREIRRLKQVDKVNGERLAPLEAELEKADLSDPDRNRPSFQPLPKPFPIPPSPGPDIQI